MAVSFQHVIHEEIGLHARPAGQLVKKAKTLPCTVTVSCGENSCEATKLMKLIGLEARHGDTINVTVQGENEAAVAEELKTFLDQVL